jgi:hypothetical protein
MNQEDIEIIEMTKNTTHLFGGREIILAPIGKKQRIGWVYKDTGLPPTEEETEAVLEKQNKLKEQTK